MPLLVLAVVLTAAGVLVGSGYVKTDAKCITKKFLWWRGSFRWDEITEIRCLKKKGIIEVHAGPQKLSFDLRFNALEHLLNEIQDRTGLSVIRD